MSNNNNASDNFEYIWQDRELRFEISKSDLKLRRGEESLDTIPNIEDIRGNAGNIGSFIFTNLRLIWVCNSDIQNNISLGYDCILDLSQKKYTSKVKGDINALFIKCQSGPNRFELQFSSVGEKEVDLLSSLRNIVKIYEGSRLYRDVKYKANLIKMGKLEQLADEIINQTFQNVSLVSQDGKELTRGQLLLGNIRLVWLSSMNENYNLSLPWIQIKTVKQQGTSKYGNVMMIETSKFFGGIGYLFEIGGKLDKILDDVTKALYYYRDDPIIGIDIKKYLADIGGMNKKELEEVRRKEEQKMNVEEKKQKLKDEMEEFEKKVNDVKIDDNEEIMQQKYISDVSNAVTYALGNLKEQMSSITDIVYSTELGLAVERLPDGVTINDLWNIIDEPAKKH